MDQIRAQYDAYPYPHRDPADEAHRLLTGSPSHPREIDHYLFAGHRDWRDPFRVLVAGGGTGDALVMLAQLLHDAGCPADIHYLDVAQSALDVARARIAARGLDNVTWHLGDICQASDWGTFDYIDCCGVLHHLPEPAAGLDALRDALAADGGMGIMVYAPHGRTGVYMLQAAYQNLLGDLPAADKLELAKTIYAALPKSAWLQRNPFVGDHKVSDTGFIDLLLNARDRPYRVAELDRLLDGAGLGIVALLEPARYQPSRYLPQLPAIEARLDALDAMARAQLAEDLVGNIKTHIAYVTHRERLGATLADPTDPAAIPQITGIQPAALAEAVARGHTASIKIGGLSYDLELPSDTAAMIALVNGEATLRQIAAGSGMDWRAFVERWVVVHRELNGVNRLHYSRVRWSA